MFGRSFTRLVCPTALQARLSTPTVFAGVSSRFLTRNNAFRAPVPSLVPEAAAPVAPAPTLPERKEWESKGFVFPRLRNILDVEKSNKIDWKPFRDKLEIFWLYNNNSNFSPTSQDGMSGASAAILKMHPGARVPPHWHAGVEHVVCLQGSYQDERGTFNQGDFMVNATGSHHMDLYSPNGCIVMLIWEKSPLYMK